MILIFVTDALQANGNLKAILLDSSPTYVGTTNLGERVAMLASATSDEVIRAVLHNRNEEFEMWRDPQGLRILLKYMLNVPAMYEHLPVAKLGEATKKHVAFYVSGLFCPLYY